MTVASMHRMVPGLRTHQIWFPNSPAYPFASHNLPPASLTSPGSVACIICITRHNPPNPTWCTTPANFSENLNPAEGERNGTANQLLCKNASTESKGFVSSALLFVLLCGVRPPKKQALVRGTPFAPGWSPPLLHFAHHDNANELHVGLT